MAQIIKEGTYFLLCSSLLRWSSTQYFRSIQTMLTKYSYYVEEEENGPDFESMQFVSNGIRSNNFRTVT